MINIAVLGYGTVGSGVVDVLGINGETINKRVGKKINIKYVLDLNKFPGDPINEKIVHDYDLILQDPEVKIIAEAMGGIEPAYSFIKKALLKGKHVCTSNKELVAQHGAELLKLAKDNKVNFLFEASVGGGIPIIRPLFNALTADEIIEITGILNGTTNYILTKMSDQGVGFEETLKEAQEKGYAEANPEADVEGHDACRKIAILSSLVHGKQVDFQDIYTEGISKITDIDFKYVKDMGASVKLLASSSIDEKGVSAIVAPFIIKGDHPLFSVNDVFNGVFVKGNVVGDTMFYGSGAGKLPTASAVVADIIDMAKNIDKNIGLGWSEEKLQLIDIGEMENRFFVRLNDSEAELAKKEFLNIEEVKGENGEYAFITPLISEAEMNAKKKKFSTIENVIRVLF